jgi:hypothetical protein
MSPSERWRKDAERFRYAAEDKVRLAFLWTEQRTPDACGVVNLHRIRYQVSTRLAKKRVQLRYDPENLDEVEVWHEGEFVERVRPLEIRRHRGPKMQPPSTSDDGKKIKADYLGFIVKKQGKEDEQELRNFHDARRDSYTSEMLLILKDRLDSSVFDEGTIREFLRRYGPWNLEQSVVVIDELLAAHPPDLHISFYLKEIREKLGGGA